MDMFNAEFGDISQFQQRLDVDLEALNVCFVVIFLMNAVHLTLSKHVLNIPRPSRHHWML